MLRKISILILCFSPLYGEKKDPAPSDGEFRVTSNTQTLTPGIHYALPANYYVVAVPIIGKTFQPGPLCREAEYFYSLRWITDDFFSANDLKDSCVQQAPFTRYRASAKDVSVDVQSRPDPTKRFVVTYGGKFNSNEFSFQLGPDGVLNKAGQNVENRKFEFFTSILQTAASIAGKFFGLGFVGNASSSAVTMSTLMSDATSRAFADRLRNQPALVLSTRCSREKEFRSQDHANFNALPDAYQPIFCHLPVSAREDFMSVSRSSLLLGAFLEKFKTEIDLLSQDPDALRKRSSSDFSSFFAAAQLVAELEELRSKTGRFLNPQAADGSPMIPDKPDGFSSLIKARSARIEEIERLFTGTFSTEVARVVKFSIGTDKDKSSGGTDEDKSNGLEVEVLKMNGNCGRFEPSVKDDIHEFQWLSGSQQSPGKDCDEKKTIAIAISLVETDRPKVLALALAQSNQNTPAQETDKQRKAREKCAKVCAAPAPAPNGLAYRIPSFGIFAVSIGGVTAWADRVPIAQYGQTAFLQEKIGSGTSHQIALDPITGSLREVSGSSRPSFTPERVQMLGGAIESAFGAAATARAALKDPEPTAPESRLSILQTQARELCEETRLTLLKRCQADPESTSCALALKACP